MSAVIPHPGAQRARFSVALLDLHPVYPRRRPPLGRQVPATALGYVTIRSCALTAGRIGATPSATRPAVTSARGAHRDE